MSFEEATTTDQLHMMLLNNNAERGSLYFYVNREFGEMISIAPMLSELRVVGDLTVKVQPLQAFLATRYRPDNMPGEHFMLDIAQVERVFATDTVFEIKLKDNARLFGSMAIIAMTIAEHLGIYDHDKIMLHRNYGEYEPRTVASFLGDGSLIDPTAVSDEAVSDAVNRLIDSVQAEIGDSGR